jgi:hypothetical protein
MLSTDALPEEQISEILLPDEVFVSHTHFVTSWWMPPRPSENAASQAQAFADVQTEIRVTRCVNEWSID